MTELFAGPSTVQMRLATGNVIAGTPAQLVTLLTDTEDFNAFLDAEKTKLTGIEALADVTFAALAAPSTNLVFNEAGGDFDFRIEGDTLPFLFSTDALNGRVGFGLAPTDGLVHIQSGSAGAVTAATNADELVVEGSGDTGITILGDSAGWSNIFLGSSASNGAGTIQYNNSANFYKMSVSSGTEVLRMSSSVVTFNEFGLDIDFRVESDLNTHMFFVDAGNNSVHIDNSLLTGAGDGDLVLANNKYIKWNNAAGTTSNNLGFRADALNNIEVVVPSTANTINYLFAGTFVGASKSENGGYGVFFVTESSADHSAPAANGCVLYTKDNGAGKTQLIARFNTGAVQVVAIEP